jgi:hypothetical protein
LLITYGLLEIGIFSFELQALEKNYLASYRSDSSKERIILKAAVT